jgi:cytochrome c1
MNALVFDPGLRLASLIFTCCLGISFLAPLASAQDERRLEAMFLDQGWSHQDRLLYYYTTQGSAIMPYDLFLHLEEAGSERLFRSDKVMVGYGMLPGIVDPEWNPDGLPVGMARLDVPSGRWQGSWVGPNCAACHNGELQYQGQRIRIDGGVNQALDMRDFIGGLASALEESLRDTNKFNRLAKRLGYTRVADRKKLRGDLAAVFKETNYYRTRAGQEPHSFGPGRIDALGNIHNRLSGLAIGAPENWVASLAPVKFPFLWNAPQSSWVQWSGVVSDPLPRNVAEAIGVFIKMDLQSKTPEEGLYESTLDLRGQLTIEKLLRRLAPPSWPEEVLGQIDRDKADRGHELFSENCTKCHSTWPHRWSEPKKQGKRFIENALVSAAYVGTDANQFKGMAFDPRPTTLPGALAPHLPAPFKDASLVPYAVVSGLVVKKVSERAMEELDLSSAELEDAHGYRAFGSNETLEAPPVTPSYKAGPREGVWATAPFLHNGSVPSIYELLRPAANRPVTFFVGREFDPIKVGIDTSGESGKFRFDTRLVGNSNKGHSFEDDPKGKGVIGRLLSDKERWAIIEYLKSIPTHPGQVTPYGGPVNPVEASKDATFVYYRPTAKE